MHELQKTMRSRRLHPFVLPCCNWLHICVAASREAIELAPFARVQQHLLIFENWSSSARPFDSSPSTCPPSLTYVSTHRSKVGFRLLFSPQPGVKPTLIDFNKSANVAFTVCNLDKVFFSSLSLSLWLAARARNKIIKKRSKSLCCQPNKKGLKVKMLWVQAFKVLCIVWVSMPELRYCWRCTENILSAADVSAGPIIYWQSRPGNCIKQTRELVLKIRIFSSGLVWQFTIVQNLAWAFAFFKCQSTTHQRPSASISGGLTTSSQTELQQPQLDFTLVSRVEFRSFANHQLDVLSKPNHASSHHHLTHPHSCTPGGF